ncbi:uncharacterized protein LOC143440096 isoform X2 [Arvicanthis niloticus]|uniref:uncharacterized protein LOC143310905 isoform X2 n=1 Tax=Arvicanthis niloticus TaxID=61156 RepID=UPI00402B5C1A
MWKPSASHTRDYLQHTRHFLFLIPGLPEHFPRGGKPDFFLLGLETESGDPSRPLSSQEARLHVATHPQKGEVALQGAQLLQNQLDPLAELPSCAQQMAELESVQLLPTSYDPGVMEGRLHVSLDVKSTASHLCC